MVFVFLGSKTYEARWRNSSANQEYEVNIYKSTVEQSDANYLNILTSGFINYDKNNRPAYN